MEEWGNGRANAYYEANVPDNVYRPKEGDQVKVVEKYIRDKYEYKKYIAKNLPPKEEETSTYTTTSNTPATTTDNNNKRTSQNSNQLNIKIGSAPNSTTTRPLKTQPPPVPVVPVAEVSLIDFLDDPIVQQASPIVTPAASAAPGVSLSLQQPIQQQPQQPQHQQFTNFMDGFGNQSSSAASPTTTTTTTTTAVGIISSTTTTTSNGGGYDFPVVAQAQAVSPQAPASHITPTVSDISLLYFTTLNSHYMCIHMFI